VGCVVVDKEGGGHSSDRNICPNGYRRRLDTLRPKGISCLLSCPLCLPSWPVGDRPCMLLFGPKESHVCCHAPCACQVGRSGTAPACYSLAPKNLMFAVRPPVNCQADGVNNSGAGNCKVRLSPLRNFLFIVRPPPVDCHFAGEHCSDAVSGKRLPAIVSGKMGPRDTVVFDLMCRTEMCWG
jgi:hypothetical protein